MIAKEPERQKNDETDSQIPAGERAWATVPAVVTLVSGRNYHENRGHLKTPGAGNGVLGSGPGGLMGSGDRVLEHNLFLPPHSDG